MNLFIRSMNVAGAFVYPKENQKLIILTSISKGYRLTNTFPNFKLIIA